MPARRGRCAASAKILGGDPLLKGLACQIEKEPSTRCIQHWREAELTDLCITSFDRLWTCGSFRTSTMEH